MNNLSASTIDISEEVYQLLLPYWHSWYKEDSEARPTKIVDQILGLLTSLKIESKNY